ncbi:unnamed protein product [Meloidogyne enterolobii]|uniref:Uncharacterized protein n=1 Tax=Meloidogyne enterolobii TaxID=390850 RepID=A0ACB1B6S4_MELEN
MILFVYLASFILLQKYFAVFIKVLQMIEKFQQNSFCTCLQLFHLICLLLFYGHVYQKIWVILYEVKVMIP